MEELEAELSSIPGYKEPENVKKENGSLKSRTDPECGYIHQARKNGLGYLTQWIPVMALLPVWTVILLTRGKVILSWNI